MSDVDIPIGKSVSLRDFRKETYITLGKFGVHLIFGKTRSGKSTILKNILCHLKRLNIKRRLIIFDPYSEYENIRFPNFKSNDYIGSYPNIKVIKDFGFKMSSFSYSDLLALGLPEMACNFINTLLQEEELHENDPVLLAKLLGEAPQNRMQLYEWNNKYHQVQLKAPINAQTFSSMNHRFPLLVPYFLTEESNRKEYDFSKEILKNNIIIDFNIRDAYSRFVYNCFAGIILNQLIKHNRQLHPIYVFDEIDLLAPKQEGFYTPAHNTIIELAIKMQREHINVIGISQNPKMVSEELTSNYHTKVMGKTGDVYSGEERAKLDKLIWNLKTGYRQFLIFNPNGEWEVFQPYEPQCIT